MYKHSDIERLLKKLSVEDPAEMEKIDEIDESVFARIEAKVLSRLSSSKIKKKAKPRIYLRTVAAAFGIIAVFSIAFYLIDIPSTRASKDPLGEPTYTNEQIFADEDISLPEYIPEGYVPDEVYESSGSFLAEYKYINMSDDSQFILIAIDNEPIQFPEGGQVIEEQEYNGLPYVFLTVSGHPDINYLNFLDSNGRVVQITATLDYDTIMKIMMSME